MNDDGTMARKADLERFAQRHKLTILTIADLIQYRMQTERLVRRLSEQTLTLDVTGTEWKAILYEVTTEPRQFLALVKGEIGGPGPCSRGCTAVRSCRTSSARPSRTGKNLREALVAIERAGRGVWVYLPSVRDLGTELRTHAEAHERKGPLGAPLREFGLGAQVLADLGLHQIKLLSNNPRKIANLAGFGLHVVERVPLLSMQR
jgi:3,4-dihydroxy 2-butanone 4-phosphate synthase/GTP cyclohydrolase II